jgi:hypothetical protein
VAKSAACSRWVRVRSLTVPVTAVMPSRAQRKPALADRIATCRAASTGLIGDDGDFERLYEALKRGLVTEGEWKRADSLHRELVVPFLREEER